MDPGIYPCFAQVDVHGDEGSLIAFWKGSNDLKPECVHNYTGALFQYF